MKDFKNFYIKYKNFLVPSVFAFLTFFIIFKVIMPQLSSISATKQEIATKTEDIDSLQQTLSTISNQNQSELTDNLDVATRALPTNKNVAVIFDALSSASEASGAELKEFSLKVGGVYGRAEKVEQTGVKGVPSLQVVVRVSSPDPRNAVKFTQEVQSRLPLVEVKSLDTTGDIATVVLTFFYKPLDLTQIVKQEKVAPLSASDTKLLDQLKSWNK